MSRLPAPPTDSAPAASRPLLAAVEKQLGLVPNLFRTVAASPAALEGYLGLSAALAKGVLPLATQERIALAVAELNGCNYCLSAHAFLAKNVAKLDQMEIAANRSGRSNHSKADAAVKFAAAVTRHRGQIGDEDLDAVRAAGYDDAAIVEIVQLVALNVWTNYINLVAQTDVDFPVVTAQAA
jgi:uncharacterized peroxidase-related enzyme